MQDHTSGMGDQTRKTTLSLGYKSLLQSWLSQSPWILVLYDLTSVLIGTAPTVRPIHTKPRIRGKFRQYEF